MHHKNLDSCGCSTKGVRGGPLGFSFVFSVAILLVEVACDTNKSTNSLKAPTVSGFAFRGTPLTGANITIKALNNDGSFKDGDLASATTDGSGNFKVTLKQSNDGPVLIIAKGGSYNSCWDGASTSAGDDSISLIYDKITADTNGLVSPMSDFAASRARRLMKEGRPVADAHREALDLMSKFYGFGGDNSTALETISPSYAKTAIGNDNFKSGFNMGGLSNLEFRLSQSKRTALTTALSADIADGKFDGKDGSTQIRLGDNQLPFTAGTNDFLSSLSSYSASGKCIVDNSITVSDVAPVLAEVRAGISRSPATPPSSGLTAGSSGAISTAAFSGKQWLFIAARSKGVVAIDISDPNAASPTIKVWEHLYTTTFERTEVGGVIALAGADHPQLLVFAYGKKKVALVNADTGVVESERDLPLVGPIVSFSGGSAYIAGGIPDTGRDGVWLATTDGYGFLARAGLAWDTTQLYAVQAPHMLAENLGGDVPHGILFSPNYARPVGGGVQLVDLTARKSYYMLDSAFSVAFRTRGLRQPDAGSVDGIYQVGIITNEDTPDVGFINLATIVKTDGSPMNTFTGGTGGTTYVKIANSLELSGSAVESSTHLALFMAGFSVSIAVGRVQDPTTTPWNGLTDWRYLPTVPNYLYSRDPHAVAAILNTFNNKAYGYLLDGSFRKAVQIDLAAFLAVAPAGTTGDSLHLIPASVDLDTTRVLKRFNW